MTDTTVAITLALAAALYVLGALLSLLLPGRLSLLASALTTGLAGIVDVAGGVALLTGSASFEANLYRLQPLGELQIRADPTSGLFLVLIGGVTLGVAIYSWGYMQKFQGATFRPFGFLLSILLLSLVGIVLANDLALFMMAWETMSITSYLLVCFEHEDRQIANAGFLMLSMSQIGTAMFLVAFLLLAGSIQGLGFDQMRAVAPSLSGGVRAAAFLLLFFGFGTKAGVIPLQIWLPVAHPAAPSNVSSLLSAVIVNMGLYGILRFAIQLLGIGPVWWGFVVAGVGSISAILGILYALMERDIKRFLAYSTVENVGIVLIGMGAAMLFARAHLRPLAGLAMLAALFHLLNHATYKSLLFLGAGAIDYAAHIRSMDRLGGLIRFMPWTAALCLIGSLSIAAVPPFNGFISEWLTLEALLQSFHIPDLASKVGLAIAGIFLALTAGLAVTAFVKAYGTTFLGMARTREAGEAREVPRSMRWGMGLLALEAVALGVLPTSFIPWFGRVAAGTYGTNVTADVVPAVYAHPGQYPLLIHLGGALFQPIVPARGPIVIPLYDSFAAASPTYLAISFLICVPLLALVVWWLNRLRQARTAEVWAGGIATYTANYQYTSSSYANPIRIIFGMIYRPGKQAETQFEASQYFRITVTYRAYVVPFFERYIYPGAIASVTSVANAAKVIQSGSVNLYLAYLFAILVVILVAVR